MTCQQCKEVYVIKENNAKLHFLSEYDELIEKLKNFMDKLSLQFETQQSICTLQVSDARVFFRSNLDALNMFFNPSERQSIKLFIQYEGEHFSLQSVLLAKPLQYFINLKEDKEFFDIINTESLTSHFQPIVDANNYSIYGYEALIRGVKDDGSLMYPDELFKQSKRNELDFRLDKLCRESALKTAATKKINQKVFINFMPTSIYDPEFCLSTTQKWANQLEFDPSQIVFEVVETELVKDQKHLKKILEFYRERGYKIALDDVGEGYSSLNLLIELRPDIIKVDRNIIMNIDKEPLKQSVYKALTTIANENGIKVLAEGVETAYELETIQDIGVDYIQGYYFAKPSAEPLRKLLL